MNDYQVGRKDSARPGSRASSLTLIGWRELVSLPDLGLHDLKAKIDTGARTSSLHVSSVEAFTRPGGAKWLRLTIPRQGRTGRIRMMTCEIPSAGVRRVRSSTGHSDVRHVLRTRLALGGATWLIELTLSNRSEMRFPMLIGRAAIRKKFLVHAGRSYLLAVARDDR